MPVFVESSNARCTVIRPYPPSCESRMMRSLNRTWPFGIDRIRGIDQSVLEPTINDASLNVEPGSVAWAYRIVQVLRKVLSLRA
jgi:hypothetical protein